MGPQTGRGSRYLLRPAPYGRQLNQHPHIHLSVTRGGLDIKHGVWRNLFFKKYAVEKIWRGAVIRLLRHSYDLINPGRLPGLGHIRDKKQWQRYLQAQYGRRWKVHFAKKTRGASRSVKYPGRYLRKPPIAGSRLAHYAGGATLSFRYHDHNTGEQATETLTQREIVARLKQHIPEKFFRRVRYF